MQPQLTHLQAAGVLPAQQMRQDQQGGHPLGDGTGDGNALGGHIAADHEHEVQYHVQHARHRQIDQGAFRVAGGTEDTVAAVVKPHTGQTDSEQLQIQHGTGEELLLGVQHLQHRLGEKNAEQTRQHTHGEAYNSGGVGGALHVLVAAHAQTPGDRHVDACAQTDEQPGEQGHQRGGGAHRAQRDIGVVRILTGDGNVAEVEQHLQHLRHHQRQAEQQDIFPK